MMGRVLLLTSVASYDCVLHAHSYGASSCSSNGSEAGFFNGKIITAGGHFGNLGFNSGNLVVKRGSLGAFGNVNQTENESNHTDNDNLGNRAKTLTGVTDGIAATGESTGKGWFPSRHIGGLT